MNATFSLYNYQSFAMIWMLLKRISPCSLSGTDWTKKGLFKKDWDWYKLPQNVYESESKEEFYCMPGCYSHYLGALLRNPAVTSIQTSYIYKSDLHNYAILLYHCFWSSSRSHMTGLVPWNKNLALTYSFDLGHRCHRPSLLIIWHAFQILAKAAFDFGRRQYTFDVYHWTLTKIAWNVTLTRINSIFLS